jgi:tetratricopeptide (TPR) repeat protein
MGKLLYFALFLLVLLSLRKSGQIPPDQEPVIGCAPAPGLRDIQADGSGRYAPVFPGWGHHSYKVQTSNDSAQFFFDQGLNLYYSYHLTEALASFKEAARRDPACVMAYWGQVLALGPYYNNYFYKMPPAVLPVLGEMKRLAESVTGREKELVEVMERRYSADTSDSRRKELNRAYASGLAELVKKYPEDVDIKALYIDAVMLEHTWDFWKNDGTPKPWTPELVAYCDDILRADPSHPAALHYQIHLVEASLHPEKALHSADVLEASMPGVPHMVHMSSHMYQRNGLYTRGVDINEKASGLVVAYDSMAPSLHLGTGALTHYNGVGAFCAMNANMYQAGMADAMHCRSVVVRNSGAVLANRTYFQYLYMLPAFVNVRSGKWKAVLEAAVPDSNWHYAALLDAFARGMAYVGLKRMDEARSCLEKLRVLSKNDDLSVRNLPFNTPEDGARVAEAILAGEICLAEEKYDEAVGLLEKGVAVEDGMIYREPRDWPIPARHYLGACLLKAGKAAAAEKVYRQDLVYNPGNGWTFRGLDQSLVKEGKVREAEKYRSEYVKAFAKAEEVPPASVY